jgi:hypothetical protein
VALFRKLFLGEPPMLDLTDLTAEVDRLESVDASAELLLKQLFDAVEANINDPAALQALVDRARAASDSLVAAISANTPAA